MQVSELLKLIKPDVVSWIQAYALGGASSTFDGVDLSTFNAAAFLTIGPDASTPNERVLTAGGGLTLTDSGPGAAATLNVVSANSAIVVSVGSLALTLAANSGLSIASGLALGTPATVTTTSTNLVSGSNHSHAIDSSITPSVRTLTAGAGLTGGGDLTANRTFDVVSGNSAIVVNANDITLTLAANSGLSISSGLALGTPSTVNTTSTNLVSGSNHSHAIDSSITPSVRTLTAGAGLTGGGDLTANRTFDVVSGNTAIVVNANDITLTLAANSGLSIASGLTIGTPGTTTTTSTNAVSGSSHTHAIDSTITPSVRTLTAGAGLTGGGDLTANRTFDVASANTAIVVNANDIEFTLAANSGLTIASGAALGTPGTVTTTSTNAVSGSSHTHAIDSTITPAVRTLTAGAGLTGGGDLTANRTFDVVSANSAIVVNANDLTLTLASESGMVISSGLALAAPGVLSVASLNSVGGATAAVPTLVSGTAVSTSAAATSLNVTVDGSAAAGHKLFCVVATRGNTVTVNTPDGWEFQETVAQTNVTMTVFTRIARTGDASSTVALSFTGSVNAAAVIVRCPDAVAGEFVNIDGSNTNAAGTSVVVNSVTTTLNNCLMLVVSTWASAASLTPDASTTELVEKVSTDASNNVGLEIAYYTQATAGATGSKTHTLSSGAGQAVGQFAIVPVASGGHQHYLGATYRPGAAAVLRTDASGYLGVLRLGLGTVVTPSYPLHIRSTSDQAHIEYDATHYLTIVVASSGNSTLAAVSGSNNADITLAPTGAFTVDLRDGSSLSAGAQALYLLGQTSITSASTTLMYLDAYSSGTTAAGFGGSILFRAQNGEDPPVVRNQAYVVATWINATDASRNAKLALGIYDVGSNYDVVAASKLAGVVITQIVNTTGSPNALVVNAAAHTTLSNAEAVDILFDLSRTVQFGQNTALTTQRAMLIEAPTYASSVATKPITNAATVAITGAPIAAGSVTITNPWAFWIQADRFRLDGDMEFGELGSTPSGTPASGAVVRMYHKADKLIFQYNDGGTIRYKYLDLTGTGVTWTHTTSAP